MSGEIVMSTIAGAQPQWFDFLLLGVAALVAGFFWEFGAWGARSFEGVLARIGK